MKHIGFRGLYPILQTPFTVHGEVDFDSMRRLVRHVCGAAEGLTFPGFASEFWRLSDEEIQECAALIAAEASPGSVVILNVTPQAAVPAVKRAREFARLGAKALMTLPPFTVAAPPAALESHLDEVLSSTVLPVIVQDSAGLTGTNLDPHALARLRSNHSNFAGLKVDQVPTGPSISRYRALPELLNLSYVVGYSGVQFLDAVRRGAEGLMGCCGHLAEDRRMVGTLLAGNGFAAFAKLSPLLNFEMQSLDLVIAVHKQLLFEAGIIATPLSRAPSALMDEFHAEELKMHIVAVRS